MAYQVDKFNGTFLTSVEDGTIDTTTDLRFVGKNYAGYGEVQNENFLHLLENFANTSAPPRAIVGQIWYDSTSTERKLKFYDGNIWRLAGGSVSSTLAPAGLQQGEFWWNSQAQQLYVWNGTDFILVGPEASPDIGTSGVVAQVVKDNVGTDRSILKILAGGTTIAIYSQVAFTLAGSEDIPGFTLIKKGVTLSNTNSEGVSTNEYQYWGTASNSLKLGGLNASEYIKRSEEEFTNVIKFYDPGFTLGTQNDLLIDAETDGQVTIQNQLGQDIVFRIRVGTADSRDVAVMTQSGVVPGETNRFSLGTDSLKWNTVYSTTFNGSLLGNVTGNVTGLHTGSLLGNDGTVIVDAGTKIIGYTGAQLRGTLEGNVIGGLEGLADNATKLQGIEPSVTLPIIADKTSVVLRNADGDIIANQFEGTATFSDRLLIDDTAVDTDPNYKSAKTIKEALTIAARDGSGNLLANIFDGTATAAQYADLAEKYLADKEYDVGTVITVGGDAEVTACQPGDRAIGAVSENPAFMMNKDLEGGTYIALKGRVPVKVLGPVKKGMRLAAGSDGSAIAIDKERTKLETFAIALESNEDSGIKLIEAIIL